MPDLYRVMFDPDKPGISGWEFETLEEAREYFETRKGVAGFAALQKVVTLEEYHRPNIDPLAEVKQRVAERRAERVKAKKEGQK